MVFRKVVEVINPQKPGDLVQIWFQSYERGKPIGEKYRALLSKHQYKVFTMSEVLLHHYNVPKEFLEEFIEDVCKVNADEMVEVMSRHAEG